MHQLLTSTLCTPPALSAPPRPISLARPSSAALTLFSDTLASFPAALRCCLGRSPGLGYHEVSLTFHASLGASSRSRPGSPAEGGGERHHASPPPPPIETHADSSPFPLLLSLCCSITGTSSTGTPPECPPRRSRSSASSTLRSSGSVSPSIPLSLSFAACTDTLFCNNSGSMAFFLKYLDSSNINNAYVSGLKEALNVSGASCRRLGVSLALTSMRSCSL